MIKKIFLIVLTCSSIFASSMFTLDNVKNLKLHFTNSTYFMDKKEQESIKKFIINKLSKAGFVFGEVDPITFVVKVKSVELDDTNDIHVISISIGLAEDVTTNRVGNIKAFAFTYMADTLIESEDPYEETLEAIDFLTCQFLNAFRDDNE